MRQCTTGCLWIVFCSLLPVGVHPKGDVNKPGSLQCPCLDKIPQLFNYTKNTATNDVSVADCLVIKGIDRLRWPSEIYCYPTDYGRKGCKTWDFRLTPECAVPEKAMGPVPETCKGKYVAREEPRCAAYFKKKATAFPWCSQTWCYVNPQNCHGFEVQHSYYFPNEDLWYSYQTCGVENFFDIWGAPLMEMCHHFSVVEKPYYVMWLSCWICAVLQQVIDLTRLLEENQARLSRGQRYYTAFSLIILITETIANIANVPWLERGLWENYNLYVYVFIHSSVFVKATMMSQVVWDWYEAGMLKYWVIHPSADGKGWSDEERAVLLVIIFQFASSLGVFGVVCCTHLIPALLVYHWIFLIAAAVLVKSRSWVAMLGISAEGKFGRAMVMGVNSFTSCLAIQTLVTCMVRVYAGQWNSGYLTPLKNDFWSRRFPVWYACHLVNGPQIDDQDLCNLFLR